MSSSPKGSLIKNFGIFNPEESGKPGSFADQVSSINYYEDVTDPSVHMTIGILDAAGRFNKLPVRSGSKIDLELENDGRTLEFNDNTEPLYISNILNYIPEAKRESYTLVLETKSAFDNIISRVFEKYSGKLSNHITEILKNKLGVPDDRMNIEDTSNDYDFCGGYRKPLHCCSWLAPKSIPNSGSSDTKGTAGYLFYQTQDGYVFKSIDSLFEDVHEDKDSVPKFEYKMDKSTLDPGANTFTFSSQPVVSDNHNIVEQLSSGQFRTANYYYDIITRKPTFVEYSYTDSIATGALLGAKGGSAAAAAGRGLASGVMKVSAELANVPKTFKDNYSRIMLSIVDNGSLSAKGNLKTPSDQFLYQAQASTRYSSLYSQSIHITVPLNVDLRAGMVIYLKLPEINKTTTDGPTSGFYLVSKLCHQFGGEGDATGLSLVRDSYLELT